ncbi:MAG: hypothetical protein JNM10_11455 [Planctomycetia bacterium]|nr:hypothetical protein [Planctomycetia bacterium]
MARCCPSAAWVLALALAGCAGLSDLSAPASPSLGNHAQDVRRKADEALAAGKFEEAWNLEAAAGTDRSRLEAIALASLAADKGPYEDMFPALRKKFGGLSTEARAKVDALAAERETAGHFDDAVDLQLVAADDAPAYEAAWGVYKRTPVKDALDVLERIQDAAARAAPPPTAPAGGAPK